MELPTNQAHPLSHTQSLSVKTSRMVNPVISTTIVGNESSATPGTQTVASGTSVNLIEPALPFADCEDCDFFTPVKPAQPLLKSTSLVDKSFNLPNGLVFNDKVLPLLTANIEGNTEFPTDYFVAMHKLISAAGIYHPAGTPNHKGARIPLQHTSLNIQSWRKHLIGYPEVEICQFLEFGFPIGLNEDPAPTLNSTLRNHGSALQFYSSPPYG